MPWSLVSALSILFKELTGLAGRMDSSNSQYDSARAGLVKNLDQATEDLATKIKAAGGDAVNIANQLHDHLRELQDAGNKLAQQWPTTRHIATARP